MKLLFLFILLGLFKITVAQAISPPVTPVPPSATLTADTLVTAPAADPRNYVLGPGDVLSVAVIDMPEVSETSVRIGPDGNVSLPLIGPVHASGLSVEGLRAELGTKLAKYINNPQITLNVVSSGSRSVSVLGEVNAPGVHELDGPQTLIQVLSLAGGVKSDAGSKVIVTRQARFGGFAGYTGMQVSSDGAITAVIPLDDLLTSRLPTDNFLMAPDDIVSVPKEQLVYVVGDVHRSGGFPMSSRGNISVLQAISLAEGPSPNAALKAAKILRPQPDARVPTEIPVDLNAILSGKAPDVPLYADDVLFVPNSAAKSGAKRAAEVMLQVATGVAIYR